MYGKKCNVCVFTHSVEEELEDVNESFVFSVRVENIMEEKGSVNKIFFIRMHSKERSGNC